MTTYCVTFLSDEVELHVISAGENPKLQIFSAGEVRLRLEWHIAERDLREPQIICGDIYLDRIYLGEDKIFVDDSGTVPLELQLQSGQNIGFFIPSAHWRKLRLTLCEDMNDLPPNER